MTCCECKYSYHLGQTCSGIAPNTFNTMGQAKREGWVCKTCRANKKQSASSSQSDSAQAAGNNDAILALVAEIKDVKKSLEVLPALHVKVDSLLLLKAEFLKLTKTVSDLEDAVTFLSKQYEATREQLKLSEDAAKTRDKEIQKLNETVRAQAEILQRLQQEQNESEQHSRKANLEIRGLPVADKEDLKKILNDLAAKIDLPEFSADEDVVAVHRLSGRTDTIPTVLVRFSTVNMKENWIKARRKLRQLYESELLPKLYFNDNLTRANRHLFWLARAAGKQHKYKFVWVRGGKIFAKKDEDSPLIRISNETDVEKIQ